MLKMIKEYKGVILFFISIFVVMCLMNENVKNINQKTTNYTVVESK